MNDKLIAYWTLIFVSILLAGHSCFSIVEDDGDEIPVTSTASSTSSFSASSSSSSSEPITVRTSSINEDSITTTVAPVSIEFKTEEPLITDETIAKKFIEETNYYLEELNYNIVNASWNFNVDINSDNEAKLLEATKIFNQEQKKIWLEVKKFDSSNFEDALLKRQFEKLSVLGIAALDDVDSEKFHNITTEMSKIYSSATVCLDDKCNLELEPDLSDIIDNSRDYDRLKEVWIKWRDNAGRPTRELYKEYIKLGNKAAKLNGFETLDDLWLFPWETPNFKEQVSQIWDEIRPYYLKLHAYVRDRLKKYYGDKMPNDGTIPAHLLGNMWAQSWGNIFDLVAPFPNKATLDVTETMRSQNYTALDMFRLSEKFFTDLALIPMPESFWKHSVITKPTGRKIVCHASAWDFYNRKDFRIKMCTQVTMKELITVHHEMGHVQYYLQYKNQPVVFREGANPGFHEAVGDLLALSVSTPNHLKKIDLLSDSSKDDKELILNYQMKMALDKIAFLPFGYLMDAWRWDLFSGKVSLDEMNKHWWWYRINYQGVSPPVKRNETDFDAGAKFHIPSSVEYIRYFVSFIIQFQFHKALCNVAQPNVPLYQCDIDGNLEAGERLAKMLQLGSSVKWPEAMKLITGTETMSAGPLIEYFSPLFEWLDQQNDDSTLLGWKAKVADYV